MSDLTSLQIDPVRTYVFERIEEGVHCPACTQLAKVYRRQIYAGMARSLILMYRHGGTDWVEVSKVTGSKGGDYAKLAHWGLIEDSKLVRKDGGKTGWWRVTPAGQLFVLGKVKVLKYALIYDDHLRGHEGEPVGIQDCLSKKFDYDELMRGQ